MRFLIPFLCVLWSMEAFAFRVCNSFQQDQYLAVAYPQNLSYVSNGWYIVKGRQCLDLNFPNPSAIYYIYFEDGKGMKGLGNTPFCIQRPGPFQIGNANLRAAKGHCVHELFTQSYLPGASVLWLGQAFEPTPPPPSNELKWLGGVSYEGGFLKNAKVELEAPAQASRLVLDLSACSMNTKVLQVQVNVLSENRYVQAQQLSNEPGTYLLPEKLSFDELNVSVNGPYQDELLPCYIPIFGA
ncbi:MAG: DUF1036 domain-containing protein [Oligoflexus sp.]